MFGINPGEYAKRFDGIVRPYSKADVERLRGSCGWTGLAWPSHECWTGPVGSG